MMVPLSLPIEAIAAGYFITVLVVSQSIFSLAPIEVNGFDIKYHSGVRVEIKVTLFAIFFF